ncbi:putative ascorbate-specific transmembrane electron transporter 1 [Platanthera guangdongensis]|uniref:Ascorbate-specific transmembrane electron transporter 1 n=1 Tax=Platanthera guangdongensis TaxID=2320717 RepID=A0ABR2LHZ2_9ASPA
MSATPAIVMAQISAIAAITLMLVWILHFRGGLSLKTSNLNRLLNAHHVLMLFGPIISVGFYFVDIIIIAIMAFKIFPGRRKGRKIIHMLLNLAGIILGGLGLYAIFEVYSKIDVLPNVHSLHSWTGLGVIGLYVIQFVIGFTCFWFPGATKGRRVDVKPWHAFFGIVIFILAIFTAGTGLIQRFRFLNLLTGSEALVLNFTGIAIVFFGIFVVLSVVLP